MKVSYRPFWASKEGNSVDEYEDAFAPSYSSILEGTEFRCAVSDGATQTSFSKQWANLLVNAYSSSSNLDFSKLLEMLPELQNNWKLEVLRKTLSWFAEEKVRQGAFATLAGLNLFTEDGVGKWSALTIGDSCIFHLKSGLLHTVFPLNSAEQFNSSPTLISTNDCSNKLLAEGDFSDWMGDWQLGDKFILLTDALACWYLTQFRNINPSPTLLAIQSQQEFEEFVSQERSKYDELGVRILKNDDVTMVRLDILE